MGLIDCNTKSACFSSCKNYRYWLTRPAECSLVSKPAISFIMLNPSTADELSNDPTITRCIRFATSWGHDGLVVANLYGFRSPKPTLLFQSKDPIGTDNEYWLRYILENFRTVVCGWGEHAEVNRVNQFLRLAVKARSKLLCLGLNKSGMPRHPLYVKSTQILLPFPLNAH